MVRIPHRARWSIVHGFRLAWRRGVPWPVFGFLLVFFVAWHMVVGGLVAGGRYQNLLRARHDAVVTMRTGLSDQKRQEFFTALQTLPFVKNATYVTWERMIERMRALQPETANILEETYDVGHMTDIVTIQLSSPRERPQLNAFLLNKQWNNAVDPNFFLHEVNISKGMMMQTEILHGVLMGMIVLLGILSILFVFCVMGVLSGDMYQSGLRIRTVTYHGIHGMYGVLPSVVACSLWAVGAAIGSWLLVFLLAGLFFPSLIGSSGLFGEAWSVFSAIGVGEVFLIPVVIGLIGCGLVRLRDPA